MARPASGQEVLEQAKEAIAKARTAEPLSAAQAVVLPLEFGLSLAQTAAAIGVSVGWTCRLRRRFARITHGEEAPQPPRGGRRRENLSRAAEASFLAPLLAPAPAGGVLVATTIKPALAQRVGRPVALSSVYNLLHRHGWRQLAPDKHPPKTAVAAPTHWKKNSPKHLPGRSRNSPERGH